MTQHSGVTEADVRAVFDDVVRAAPSSPHRLAAIEGRVRQARRRRSLGTTLVLVAALVGGGVATTRPGRGQVDLAGHAAGVAPQYWQGGRLLASVVGSAASGVTLTFIPTSLDLQFGFGCTEDTASAQVVTELTLNGHHVTGGSCLRAHLPASLSYGIGQSAATAKDLGVVPGQPSVLRYQPAAGFTLTQVSWEVAVYEDVSVSEYVFPPAPSALPLLAPDSLPQSSPPNVKPLRILRGQGIPALPASLTDITWQESYPIRLSRGLHMFRTATVPGDLEILVNGKVVWATYTWSYDNWSAEQELTLAQLGLSAGATATITVTARRYIGASWVLGIYDEAGP